MFFKRRLPKYVVPIAICLMIVLPIASADNSGGGSGGGGSASCDIKDNTAPVLTDYISNLESAISTIQSGGSSTTSAGGTCAADKNAGDEAFVRATSVGEDATSFASYAEFEMDTRLTSEVPDAVERDHTLLLSELDKLKSAFEAVYANCGDEQPVQGTIPNYVGGQSRGRTLMDLVSNHIRILNYYRKVVGGGGGGHVVATEDDPAFILVDDTQFRQDLQTSYGPKAYNECVAEGDLAKNVDQQVDQVGEEQDDMS